jgi:hypothetical protein
MSRQLGKPVLFAFVMSFSSFCPSFIYAMTVVTHSHFMEAPFLGGHRFINYETSLDHVSEYFSDENGRLILQPWNRRYEKACQIFNNNTVLYSVEKIHDHYYHKQLLTTKSIEIENGKEFLSLILKDKQYIRFTYVVLPDGTFRFSETGIHGEKHRKSQRRKDKISKHAIHARGAEHVIYAGEFYVIQREGQPVLVFDNNSGTYAPDRTLLGSLKKLMESNFPGVAILAVSRKEKLDQQAI